MNIEIYIDGEKKLFTTPIVPMLAKRKYLEVMAKDDPTTFKEQIEEDDAHLSIIADVIFDGQFTIEQLYKGASEDYVKEKLREAVFGIKKETESIEGNQPGE